MTTITTRNYYNEAIAGIWNERAWVAALVLLEQCQNELDTLRLHTAQVESERDQLRQSIATADIDAAARRILDQ